MSSLNTLSKHEKPPLIAILLCTYNGEKFLSEQLDSIANQSYQNWFVIVSDDGSTDRTLKILEDYKTKWPSGKLTIRNGPKKGYCKNFLSLACNTTIKADYYAFSDQDDVWLSEKLFTGISSLKKNCVKDQFTPALYGGKTIYVDKNLKEFGQSSSFNYPKIFKNALVQTMAGGNTLIFNKATKLLLEKVGDVNAASHDWWLYLIVSGADGICIFDNNPKILYRQHKNSIVGQNITFFAKLQRIIFLFGGKYKKMIDMNIEELIKHKKYLSKSSAELLDKFIIMRNSNIYMRIRLFNICGLFRQTRKGTIALFIAVLFNQI